MARFGSNVSSCFSSWVVSGKIFESEPSMGVTASPGRFTIREIDRMAQNVITEIGVLPVWIISLIF